MNLSTQAADLGQTIINAVLPKTPPKASGWSQVLAMAQMPVLAFFTALAAGGVLIGASDLDLLSELYNAINRLQPTGYLLVAVAVILAIAALWTYFETESVLRRFSTAIPSRGVIWLARTVAVVGGSIVVYEILGLAGFGPTMERGGAAIRTAYGSMLEGSLGDPTQMIAALRSGDGTALIAAFNPIMESLVSATPYILSGLAVAIGIRGGVFNIGVEGQLFIGAILATFVGYSIGGLPSIVHITLALGAAALGGAFWALIPALLKAKFGAHEVINTIMMNYIAFRLSEWLLIGPMTRPGTSAPVSPFILASAEFPRFFAYPSRLHIGFFIALGLAFFIYWLLFRTTFGLEIRAVGANPSAARYAGINVTKNIILTMCLSGALAGIAGANELLGVNHTLTSTFSPGYGFDSIALSLLGGNHPLGVVFASLLFGTLRSGGTRMQNVAKIPVEIISVVQSLVIVFVAAPSIVSALYHLRGKGKGMVALTRGWGK